MKKTLIVTSLLTVGFCCWCALSPRYVFPKRIFLSLASDSLPDIRYEKNIRLTQARYDSLQQCIIRDKGRLAVQSEDSVRKYFQQTLYYKMIPYWLGTPWDFNGYTAIPGQGEVACGYLVSTTLKQMGVNVNRYKLAQQYSHGIVKSLCQHDSVFTNKNKMLTHIQSQPDDIWIVGLDNHVGFLFKEGSHIRFVHSTFVSPACVCDERAEVSEVLASSNVYVVGSLLHHNNLMKKWLTGQAVVIVP